jgi:hypothetical protein
MPGKLSPRKPSVNISVRTGPSMSVTRRFGVSRPEMEKSFVDDEPCGPEEQHNRVCAIVGGTCLFQIAALHVPLHQVS